jgi:hypothetical protein
MSQHLVRVKELRSVTRLFPPERTTFTQVQRPCGI